ncbi:helix-turn-helix transcriptional regulator [Paenibacillus sp. P46E]|uniref:helix-turn-helix transcriptional regulator n=1 Tax=Paenibacillus sp. P46E TaxID=1349436 RepID=UPI00093E155F|nr:helix-turn-helix transcriptional regulator [Paenibacillus sp. P46E]OKP97757.1 XRE family transcriptional regulator [Paenibacillus sp. P46E]
MKVTIKAARVNSGMKSKDVAKALGLSANGYCRKENGHNKFYIDEIAQLSRMFKVPFENFFEAECLYKTQ